MTPKAIKKFMSKAAGRKRQPDDVTAVWRGFDTETQDGKAILVCTEADQLLWPASFDEIAYFLLEDSLNASGSRLRYASYNMDYDARAIMWFLPKDVRTRLTYVHAVDWQGWRIGYLPRKYFMIQRREKKKTLGWMECFDMAQFFGGPLKHVAKDVLGLEKSGGDLDMKHMARELERRPQEVVDYCKLDADLVRRLALYLEAQFVKLEVPFDRPISSGYLFRLRYEDTLRFNCPPWEHSIARQGYHGGRVEVFQRGYFKGPLTLWDINSAYPAVLSTLIDPHFCDLRHTKTYTREGVQYGTYYIEAWIPPSVHIGPIPVRLNDKGVETTKYPVGYLRAWVDRPTLELTAEVGTVRVLDAYEYLVQKPVLLFSDIPKLYARRKTIKSMSLAIKLLLNAGYGKLASQISDLQRTKKVGSGSVKIGGHWYRKMKQSPGYTHLALAAHVTGTVRAWDTRGLWSVPAWRAIFAATDSALLHGSEPPRVPVGGKLGEWSLKGTYKAAVVVGSGVYALQEQDGTWRSWVRGYEKGISLPLSIRKTLGTAVEMVVKRVDSLRETVRSRHWDDYNVIREVSRDLSLNFDTKRVWSASFRSGPELLKTQHKSVPIPLLPASKVDRGRMKALIQHGREGVIS